MINTFKVGDNLDNALVNSFEELNQKYSNKITEVFGSIQAHWRWAARPKFRLTDISLKDFEQHVALLLKHRITFNYTLNAPVIGSSSEIEEKIPEIDNILHFLFNIGITDLTITSPLLARIIYQLHPTWFKFELSTIAAMTQVTQLKGFNSLAKFTKFCVNVEKNRDFKWLAAASKCAKENGYTLDLMVNEFCSTSDVNFSCNCVLRQECYNLHSVNKSKEDYMKFGGYPMNFCMAGRAVENYSWLRSRFILPQWLKYYNDIGISHFKITGRTGSTAYIKKITEAYMTESWTGNLLELWKQLQSIYDGKSNSDNDYIDNYLNSDIIHKKGFLDHWRMNPSFVCGDENCGVSCNYCKEFYDTHLKRN